MKEINIYRKLETGNIDDLYKYLDYIFTTDEEFLLDFVGTSPTDMEDIINLLSICLRLQDTGIIIKFKNVPMLLRKKLFLSGITYVDEMVIS